MIGLQGSKLLLLKPCYHIETQHLLPQLRSITSPLRSQVHLEPPPPVLPHDPLALKDGGEGGREGGFEGWRRSLLTRVSTWRVRTGLSVSGPASARHTVAPLSSSSSSSSWSGQSKGRRDMTRPAWGTGAPGQAVRVQATRTPQLQARLVWAGRKERAPPPPACPHLLEGRSQHSVRCDPCDPRLRILTPLLAFPAHDDGHVIAPICHFITTVKGALVANLRITGGTIIPILQLRNLPKEVIMPTGDRQDSSTRPRLFSVLLRYVPSH